MSNPDVVLAGALPQLRAAELRLRALAAKEGIGYAIADFGAVRTQADTTRILAYRDADYKVYLKSLKPGQTPKPITEWRRIAPFGHSYHNYGAAFDVTITQHPGTMTQGQALTHLGALAPLAGLRWGAAFGDTPHFELAITLDAARMLWERFKGGGAADDASRKLSAILAGGIPGLSVTGGAGVSSITVAAARTPAARAALTTGALVVVGLLTWVAVRRLIDD